MAPIEVGTTVEWTSQSGGYSKTKRGVVCAVIPAGADVRDHLTGLQRCFAKEWSLMGRREVSYVVHVRSKSGAGAGKLYWPRAQHLRVVCLRVV